MTSRRHDRLSPASIIVTLLFCISLTITVLVVYITDQLISVIEKPLPPEPAACLQPSTVLTNTQPEYHNVPEKFVTFHPNRSLVIYTRYRSGSTFAGSLFDENPEVYYFFEPMKMVEYSFEAEDEHIFNRRMKNIFSCDLTVIQDNVNNNFKHWKDLAFCPFEPRERCTTIPTVQYEEWCLDKSYRVSKDIAIPSLESIHDLMVQGVHVVHLVRDPRGMLSSRLKIDNHGDTSVFQQRSYSDQIDKLKSQCIHLTQDINRMAELYPGLNYYLIRYEDLALKAAEYATALYKLVGFPFNEDVVKVIQESTVNSNTTSINNPYGTQRNASATVHQWVTHLPPDTIATVEILCREAMEMLGYKLITPLLEDGFYDVNDIAHTDVMGDIPTAVRHLYVNL